MVLRYANAEFGHKLDLMQKLENLKIWVESMDLAKEVYRLLEGMPDSEKFGLTSQMKRAVVSISSCIAEGAGRNSKKDFARFLSMANGSSFELKTQLILSTELYFVEKDKVVDLIDKIDKIQKMNYRLQMKLSSENQ